MFFRLLLTVAIFFLESQSASHYRPLVECVFEIFKKYASIAVVSNDREFNDELYELNAEHLRTTITVFDDVQKLKPPKEVASGFLIVSDAWEEVIEAKKRAANGALVMVVMKEYNETSLLRFFEYSWRYRYKDIIVAQYGGNGGVYAFDPFLNQTKKFGTHQVKEMRAFLKPKDYQGTVVTGTLFETTPLTIDIDGVFQGVDPMMIETISRCLNVTIETHVPYDDEQFGYRSKNGSSSGAIKELYTKQSEIGFNQVFVKEYDAPELTFTKTFLDECLCVVVPKAGPIPKWTAIFYAFSKTVWVAILLIVTATMVGLFLIRRYSVDRITKDLENHHAYDPAWSTVFLDVCQGLVNVTYSNIFSSKYHHRIILGALFLFALIINTLFQSSLVTVMTNRKHYPDINTMKQLAESNLQISTYAPSLGDVFNNTGNQYMEKLNRRFFVLSDETRPLPAILSRRLKYDFLIGLKQEGTQNIHVVQECARSYAIAYMVPRDAYFLEDFNTIISKAVEGGFINKWTEMLKMNLSELLLQSRYIEKHVDFPRAFNVVDLQTTFYILIVGYSISYIAFLFEYYSARCYYLK